MTSTLTPTGPQAGPSPLVDAPKITRRSRGPEALVGVIVLVASVVAALWVFTSASDRTPALALVGPVARGEVLETEDLVTVEVASDDALVTVHPQFAGDMVGRVALVDLSAGVLVTADQFTSATPVPEGQSVVGLSLEPGEIPTSRIGPGTQVKVVLLPPSTAAGEELSGGEVADRGEILVEEATVIESMPTGSAGALFVSLSMDQADAEAVAVADSLGRVRLLQVPG